MPCIAFLKKDLFGLFIKVDARYNSAEAKSLMLS